MRVVVGTAVQQTDAKRRADVQRAFAPAYELPLDTGFASVLRLSVGVHRLRIDVQRGDGSWITVRRAVLLRVPGTHRVQQPQPGLEYDAWTRVEEKRLKAEIPDIKRHIQVMIHRPTFTAVVDTRQGAANLEDTIQSIRDQLYPFLEVRVLSDAPGSSLPDGLGTLTDMTLSDIQGEFIVFMQSGQRLASIALYAFADALNRNPEIDLIYGDEDSWAASGGRRDPFHKPGWSPDYLETFNYIGFPACFRAAIARGCFLDAHVYDIVLRFTERTTRVAHVPKILGHGLEKVGVEEAALASARDIKALSGRLVRTGRRGSVCENSSHKGCYGVRLDLKRSPLVSVVIPTAGRTVRVRERRIDLIENVINHIRNRSTYTHLEVIVVDNGDLSPTQLRVLAEADCKRVSYSEDIFNVAKKLNLGVSVARGELLLLMNDDIEVLTPSWIERLLEHFEKPHVGVVGAKLLYPNEQTQHVGVVHNFGNPDHVRRHFPRDDAGYMFSTCGVRNYSAVTGACMMTRASLYREVGGYSHELAVNFNDVDFCMKVRGKGFSVVYAPDAELIHMESLSHVVSLDMEELAWFHQRWAAELVSDQFYNERFLAVEPPTFEPCVNQRML
jgi:GT2 family glycosyltransferase